MKKDLPYGVAVTVRGNKIGKSWYLLRIYIIIPFCRWGNRGPEPCRDGLRKV